MVIDDVSAFTFSRTLRTGRLTYDLLSPDSVPSDKSLNCQLKRNKSCNGWRCLLLVVYLEGDGNDGDATQLFYQDCNEQPDFCPLDVTITLKPLEIITCTCPRSNKLPPLSRTYSEGSRQFCNTVSGTSLRRSSSLRQPRTSKLETRSEETNVDHGTFNANPAGSELLSIRRHSEQLQMVSEVGSIKHKRRRSVPSKPRGKNKTHPEFRRSSTRVESTDIRIKKTVATFAIDEYSRSSRGNIHSGAGLSQGGEQHLHEQGEVRLRGGGGVKHDHTNNCMRAE
ncbi:hypothetical protein BSL78_01897 [Apostichopus japonicus]|uniref:Uncharacterized protein n=1 Tax=Stichopus japonicus TaxID=307972 RepID=A0A2G8LLX6_STIJA|nr:hypothetical protein BSL78_01897 [Apostichopus japonicus]